MKSFLIALCFVLFIPALALAENPKIAVIPVVAPPEDQMEIDAYDNLLGALMFQEWCDPRTGICYDAFGRPIRKLQSSRILGCVDANGDGLCDKCGGMFDQPAVSQSTGGCNCGCDCEDCFCSELSQATSTPVESAPIVYASSEVCPDCGQVHSFGSTGGVMQAATFGMWRPFKAWRMRRAARLNARAMWLSR